MPQSNFPGPSGATQVQPDLISVPWAGALPSLAYSQPKENKQPGCACFVFS